MSSPRRHESRKINELDLSLREDDEYFRALLTGKLLATGHHLAYRRMPGYWPDIAAWPAFRGFFPSRDADGTPYAVFLLRMPQMFSGTPRSQP